MHNYSAIRRLPANSAGKDYVVGDLHGCYHLLERLLEHVWFDPGRDRLFSVGDMIDRGPDSLRCLQLLAEPWFHAVLGNHECMLLDFLQPNLSDGKLLGLDDMHHTGFLEYGGEWIMQYHLPHEQSMTAEFNRCWGMVQTLPYILVVGECENRFHVLHAELMKPGIFRSQDPVWLNTDIDGWLLDDEMLPQAQTQVLWGRILMQGRSSPSRYPKTAAGLSTTFCGHTYANSPRQVLSHICVDTGAFVTLNNDDRTAGQYGLTIFDVQDSCWFSAAYGKTEIVAGSFTGKAAYAE